MTPLSAKIWTIPALLSTLALLQACGRPEVAAVPALPPPSPPPAVEAEPEAAPPAPLDGRLVVNAWEYPWSAIGRLNTGGRGFCTGVLVGERLVLAPASCLYNARTGRWWRANELHFRAAYHQDDHLAASPVERYRTAPGFNPQAGTTLANLTNNWALISLRAPVGRQTGWLGLAWRNAASDAALARGTALQLSAGYRRDWAHAISVHFGCPPGDDRTASGIERTCTALPGERALPAFLLIRGELKLLADRYQLRAGGTGDLARLVGGAAGGGQGRAPGSAEVAAPLPYSTIDRLLYQMGYLRSAPDVFDPVARREAIRSYQTASGRPATGEATIELLSELFLEARRRGA